MKKKSEGDSEVLAWVSKSRKLEEKRNVEKEKALQLSKVFEEQVSYFLNLFPVFMFSPSTDCFIIKQMFNFKY